jgi:hypothetical protein
MHRIDGDAASVERAEITRVDKRSLQRRRRQRPDAAQLPERDPASRLIEWIGALHVALAKLRRIEVESETGCVGEVRSPGAAPCGTGVSVIGTSGWPVSRLST